MKLLETRKFTLEARGQVFEYDIVCDDVELMLSAGTNIGNHVKQMQDLISKMANGEAVKSDPMQFKFEVKETGKGIINTFLGDGAYSQLLKDTGRLTFSVTEMFGICQELIELWQLNKSTELQATVSEYEHLK